MIRTNLTEEQETELKYILKDCMKQTLKKYRDPEYNCNIKWNPKIEDMFNKMMEIFFEECDKKLNIRLKRKNKK